MPDAIIRKGSSITDFIEQRNNKIRGVTPCFDRVVLTGTIPGICYAEGMTRFLTFNNIRIFDYPQWAHVYFVDVELGLCYLRVPTYTPFRLQFYFNGHYKLAAQLANEGVDAAIIDNCFVSINDFDQAQTLADDVDIKRIRRTLDTYACRYCPVIKNFKDGYHWSIMQVEYASDIVFKRQSVARDEFNLPGLNNR